MAPTNQISRSQSSAAATTIGQAFTQEQLERLKKVVDDLVSSDAGLSFGTLAMDFLRAQDLMAARVKPITLVRERAPVGFLTLPAEVRNKIYHHCLVVGKVFTRPKPFRDHRLDDYKTYKKPQTQIFELCRQTFLESAPMYFVENRFIISYGTHESSWPWKRTDISLSLYRFAIQNVRKLSISFDSKDSPKALSQCYNPNPEFNKFDEKDLEREWDARISAAATLNLDSLEVSLAECYCDSSNRRMVHEAISSLLWGLKSRPHVIMTGLKGSERSRLMLKILKVKSGADVEGRDPNDKQKIAFRPRVYLKP